MRDFFTAYTNTNAVAFPDTEGINASGPSETDGTEFVKISVDDGYGWGWIQALLTAAGLTPNGSPESVSNSQVLDSHEILFGIPDKYISGLVPLIAADTDHDITFGVGEARSALASSLERILLATAITKQIDVDWAAGNDAGGFPSGLTLAIDTWYYLFGIKNNASGVVDAGFDTSITAANLLSDATGYTEFRRIGSVLTDGSFNIIAFTAVETAGGGLEVLWDVGVQDFSSASMGTAEVLRALSVPTGYQVIALGTYVGSDLTPAGAVYWLFTSPDQDNIEPTVTIHDIRTAGGAETGSVYKPLRTSPTGQIRTRVSPDSETDITLRGHTFGWIDQRR